MNSMPADSSAALTASKELRRPVTSFPSASRYWIVRCDRPAADARSFADQPSIARAARICTEVTNSRPFVIAYIAQIRYFLRMHDVGILDWRAQFRRLEGAYAPSTMRSYYSDVEAFEKWSHSQGLSPFPASVDAVCRFLEAQGRAVGPSTVRRRLYGIRKAHRLLDLPDPTRHEDVNLALRKARRMKPNRPKQAKGMTREYLEQFLEVQPDTPLGLRNRAMLSLGYDLLARRSELVALRTEDVAWRKDGTMRVLIRRSKTDQLGEGRIAFTSKRSAQLLEAWLDYRGMYIEPLFCPVYQGKAINRQVSDMVVRRLIRKAAESAGLAPSVARQFSGHSMRVGAAQDLLSAGHDTAAIMHAGGWKSVNVLARYLQFAEHNVWA
jgi:integrase/recombinase XerD